MKKEILIGAAAGFLNGLFGSGGGIAAALLLKKSGLPPKEAQATALFIMIFLSAVSCGIYYFEGNLSFSDAAGFIPGGILGAVFSIFLLKKISPVLLEKIFGGFIVFSSVRMIIGVLGQWM